LVFDGDRSWVHELPISGSIIIGRAADAELQLADPSVSRKHAQILTAAGQSRIADLGSQNGTLVNGERIAGERRLLSGDSIALSGVTVVYHQRRKKDRGAALLDQQRFVERLEQEVERAVRYHRPLELLAVAIDPSDDHPRVQRSLVSKMRGVDVAGWATPDLLIAVLPETRRADAQSVADRASQGLKSIADNARVGLATCPDDGCDVDSLLAALRSTVRGDATASTLEVRVFEARGREIVIADPALLKLYALIERLAQVDLPVLVQGETGCGKEAAVHALHAWSKRHSNPLVVVNCPALPESLLESELFGHEKGAFSGADQAKTGLIEAADGGTVFLDEIGEMPLAIQAKLLRVLESKTVQRLGSVTEKTVDVRIVAATNRDLRAESDAGRFRRDLYFRLNGASFWIPPLRDRKREIVLLAHSFIAEACKKTGRPPMELTSEAAAELQTYDWPGNVRELKNVIDFVVAVNDRDAIEPWMFTSRLSANESPMDSGAPTTESMFRPLEEEIRELEKSRISAALDAAKGNQKKAAELIGMPLRTFVTKLGVYGLRESKRS
jgi:two-component system, NtrC family, response regulator AtoC